MYKIQNIFRLYFTIVCCYFELRRFLIPACCGALSVQRMNLPPRPGYVDVRYIFIAVLQTRHYSLRQRLSSLVLES